MTNPISTSALQIESELLCAWLSEKALPFWAETAIDSQGGWYEHLALDGGPNTDVIRRLRVQARQIYVYALADKMGWYSGQKIVSRTFDFMLKYGFEKGEQPGFIHLLTPEYETQNRRRDLYDHAFYLFSCAWAHDATQSPQPLQVANKIEAFLDTLKSPHGGWIEGTPETFPMPRRQNPHMHLLEAFMAWHDVSGAPHWMAQADDIIALFKHHFFDAQHLVVREYFQDDWEVASGPAGETSEPGHLAEWIWLLWMYEERSGVDTSLYADALYARLTLFNGLFLNDEENIHGKPRRETKRLWVQTELIKAHLAQASRGNSRAAKRAARAMQTFRETYLHANGTWTDQFDENGQAIATTIPTSSFYHIICMIYEAQMCARKRER